MTKKRWTKSLDDYRTEYSSVFGKFPPSSWSRWVLRRKIKEQQAVDANAAFAAEPLKGDIKAVEPSNRKTDFEKLAGVPDVESEQKLLDEIHSDSKKEKGRAGRPTGQTDERARIERLLKIEVPDLVVLKVVMGVCYALGRYDKNPFSKEQVTSMALGATRELYYWFPAADGKISQWALHAQALEDIGKPISDRALEAKEKRDEQKSEKEIEDAITEEKKEDEEKSQEVD